MAVQFQQHNISNNMTCKNEQSTKLYCSLVLAVCLINYICVKLKWIKYIFYGLTKLEKSMYYLWYDITAYDYDWPMNAYKVLIVKILYIQAYLFVETFIIIMNKIK